MDSMILVLCIPSKRRSKVASADSVSQVSGLVSLIASVSERGRLSKRASGIPPQGIQEPLEKTLAQAPLAIGPKSITDPERVNTKSDIVGKNKLSSMDNKT